MASPSIRSVGTGSETAPAWGTHATGDKGYLFVHSEAANVTTPSGWTLVNGFPAGNVAATVFLYAFEKTAASASEAAVTLTGGTVPYGFIIAVQDAWGYIASAAAGGSGGVTTGVCPGVRSPVDDTLVINVLAWAVDNAGPIASAWTNTSLASFTEQFDAGTITGGGGGLTAAAGTLAGAGNVDPATVTLTSTQFAGGTLVIAPGGQNTYSGTVTIDGAAAPNHVGGTSATSSFVRFLDVTQPAASCLVTDANISGGAGAYTVQVPYSDHKYVPCYEQFDTDAFEVVTFVVACSGEALLSGTGRDITHYSSGGGGITPPRLGSAFIR